MPSGRPPLQKFRPKKLADEADVVSAFHQLQKLHQEFRDTGPVANVATKLNRIKDKLKKMNKED